VRLTHGALTHNTRVLPQVIAAQASELRQVLATDLEQAKAHPYTINHYLMDVSTQTLKYALASTASAMWATQRLFPWLSVLYQ
jgi:hypothetical protein